MTGNCWLMLIVDCVVVVVVVVVVTSGKQHTKPVMICVFKWFTEVDGCT
jgi:hypothetical protein